MCKNIMYFLHMGVYTPCMFMSLSTRYIIGRLSWLPVRFLTVSHRVVSLVRTYVHWQLLSCRIASCRITEHTSVGSYWAVVSHRVASQNICPLAVIELSYRVVSHHRTYVRWQLSSGRIASCRITEHMSVGSYRAVVSHRVASQNICPLAVIEPSYRIVSHHRTYVRWQLSSRRITSSCRITEHMSIGSYRAVVSRRVASQNICPLAVIELLKLLKQTCVIVASDGWR